MSELKMQTLNTVSYQSKATKKDIVTFTNIEKGIPISTASHPPEKNRNLTIFQRSPILYSA